MVFKGRSTDTFEMDDIEVYQLVKDGSLRSYPSGFWDGVTASKTAEKITKYVFKDVLNWSIDDIKVKVTREVFEEYKLVGMLKNIYDSSMYICLGEVYPELKEWASKQYQTNEHADFIHRRYSDDELIYILQEKSKELNRIPKGVDMKTPSSAIYSNRFGSWEKSLMKAGLIEDIYKDVDFEKNSKESVISYLKELFAEKERVLDKDEIFAIYPEGLIKEYFGTYKKVEKVIVNEYTKKELTKILKKKQEKLGRVPSNKDMKFPMAIVFIDKFGSWQEAIEKLEKT